MITSVGSRIIILLFGTLYPAYGSYKAMRSKDIMQFVKWMMYWIVFSIFTSLEIFTDVLLSWIPFYYELKVLCVFWLVCPVAKGCEIIYCGLVYPMLVGQEEEIDKQLDLLMEWVCLVGKRFGSKFANYAASLFAQAALQNVDSAYQRSLSNIERSNLINVLRLQINDRAGSVADGADGPAALRGSSSLNITMEKIQLGLAGKEEEAALIITELVGTEIDSAARARDQPKEKTQSQKANQVNHRQTKRRGHKKHHCKCSDTTPDLDVQGQ